MNLRHALGFAGLLFAGIAANDVYACASCGCSLSTDGATGYSASTGWGISLDYTFINQDQNRHDRSAVDPSAIAALNPGANQEVEKQTINRYLTLGVSYAPSADWNFKMLLPYVNRDHSTWGAATNPISGNALDSVTVDGLGDVKFIASYQGILPTHNLGVQLGVKLPTGAYGGVDANGVVVGRPAYFAGTTSTLDTSLQIGNGSTDLILGGYYYRPISQDYDAFVNGQYQFSVAQKLNNVIAGADYRPGDTFTVSTGVRYVVDPHFVPQLQINATHKTADTGALATQGEFGTTVYLSPGVTYALTHTTQAYGFFQLPVYSQLGAYQLFPHYTVSVGVSHHF